MSPVRKRLHITGSRDVRPPADRVIFCDGGVDTTFRPGVDLELSHWIPNRTPDAFRADTSTEICLNFVAAGDAAAFDLVVNNHVDVDGVLSTFTLIHPELALAHRRTLIQAAEMGDFWAWADADGQTLFQSLACLMRELRAAGTDAQEIYLRCFERTRAILSRQPCVEVGPDGGLFALNRCVERIARGEIARKILAERFVHYRLPVVIAMQDPIAALEVSVFNAPIHERALLPPHARAKFDQERVQLVSTELSDGWRHDLWLPGHSWADTVTLWRPPDLRPAGSSNAHYLHYPQLTRAVNELAAHESATGEWVLADKLSPFGSVAGRNFPIVLAYMKSGAPAPSAIPPDAVCDILAAAFP